MFIKKFALAFGASTGLFVAMQGVITKSSIADLVLKLNPNFNLGDFHRVLLLVALFVFVASLRAHSNEDQSRIHSIVKFWQEAVVFAAALVIATSISLSDVVPREPQLPPVPGTPPSAFTLPERQELRDIILDLLRDYRPPDEVTPEQLFDVISTRFQERYGFSLGETEVCLVRPRYSNISVRIEPRVSESQIPLAYLWEGEVVLAIAHNGGEVNNGLWWFVRYVDDEGLEQTGWVSSWATDEITLGCDLLRRDVAAYLGAGN